MDRLRIPAGGRDAGGTGVVPGVENILNWMRYWLVLACLPVMGAERIPVVLSTDVGNEVDDQWAIVYLLTQPRFDVKGLLSAHAPTLSPPAGRTAYRVLRNVVEER